jgi:hypothetical protein
MPNEIFLGPIDEISEGFSPEGPAGGERGADVGYRALKSDEIATLVKNDNGAESWDKIFVSQSFNPDLISGCEFYGEVYLGDLEDKYIEYHDLRLPVGIRDSTIMSCRIGKNVAIRDVHYLAHYVVGDNCIIINVDEMLCTNHAKFGNGIVKEGEDEEVRIWLEVSNENDGRKILPFEGLLPADAYIWSKYRDDEALLGRFVAMTEARVGRERGRYGEVGSRTVIKDCKIIKDTKVGSDAYIKGANKLKNITILSSGDEGTQIGEGVELVNGIVGYGNRIFYESKAIRFVTGRNVQLKYGARLLNSVLGDNSTVSCCELLNNLIFPFHEQHHNNSFLIASTIMGQSNIAAGATIGSNHNSRAPDGEIVAGRGFWPGLCSSFKHNSRFASFVLVAKGSYSYELDIAYPFSLVSMGKRDDYVHVSPAYWFVHNMYAMARNSWKFRKRDGRKVKEQNIELEYLAPDTVDEMLRAMARLEYLAGREEGASSEDEARAIGRELLSDRGREDSPLVEPKAMRRYGGIVEKPGRGWRHYRDFCAYFAVKTLVDYLGVRERPSLEALARGAAQLAREERDEAWVNLGGQIVSRRDLDELRADVRSGELASWDSVHARYGELWAAYPEAKARYATLVIERALGLDAAAMGDSHWRSLIASTRATFKSVRDSAFASRRKDYEDPFRKMVYDSDEEMYAVLGRIEDNSFLNDLERQTRSYLDLLDALAK